MELKIDTEKKLSEMEKQILYFLLDFKKEEKTEPTELVEQEIRPNLFFKKRRGDGKEVLLRIIEHLESATVYDIIKHTDMEEKTVRTYLSKLKQNKKIDSSIDRPKKYFLRNFNPELKELLKNVKKR